MKTVKQTYVIKAPALKVWKALVDPEHINNWGGGPAKMSDELDFKFSLWKGEVFGKNLEVSKKEKLKQEWWSKEDRWDEPSIVTFTLKEKNGKTTVDLLHETIPNKNFKDIEEGWKKYYFGPLKLYVEKN